jgi:glycosyltransferase involved in cell wall biosynthesis
VGRHVAHGDAALIVSGGKNTHAGARTRSAHSQPGVGEHPSTSRLRVVYLDHVAQLSGGELALLRLLKALTEVDAHVILSEDGPLVERLVEAGISVEVFPLPARTRLLRKGSVRAARLPLLATYDTIAHAVRLALRLRRLRPDIVHTNSLKSGIYGSIAGRLAGTPVVWHLRDRLDPEYLPRAGVLLVRLLTRSLPDVVVSNSEATKRTLISRKRSFVVPSAVDLGPFGPRPTAPRTQRLLVGIVGRLAPWKGQDVFLRAFARAFPDGCHRAVVVGAPLFGEAETAYECDLRRLAEELGVSDRVEFRGHREDIASELARIDILVHASIVPEPFGQTIIEGMSAQLAVVASRGGGPEEIITEGVDGLLYEPGDFVALAVLLTQLEANPQLRVQLGCAGGRRARDFSPEVVAKRMMHAYSLARRDAKQMRTR